MDSDQTIDSDELEELMLSQKTSEKSGGVKKKLKQSREKDSDTDQTIDSDELEKFVTNSQKKTNNFPTIQKKGLKLEKMSDSDEDIKEETNKNALNKSSKRFENRPMKSLGLWSDSDSEKEEVKKKKVRVSLQKSQHQCKDFSDSDSASEKIRNDKVKNLVTDKSQFDHIKSLGLWSNSENESEEGHAVSFSSSKVKSCKDISDSDTDCEILKKKNLCHKAVKNKDNKFNTFSPSTSRELDKKVKQNNLNKKPLTKSKQISNSDSNDKILNIERISNKRSLAKYKEVSDSDSQDETVKKKANISKKVDLEPNASVKDKKVGKNILSKKSLSKLPELSDSDNEAVENSESPSMHNLSKKREKCRYGKNCYRKNPDHIKNFDHGSDTDESNLKRGDTKLKIAERNSPSTSNQSFLSGNRSNSTSKGKTDSLNEKNYSGNDKNTAYPGSKGFEFYLTKVNGIPQKYNLLAFNIKDLLSFKDVTLISSAQFNYMFDVPWLLEQYPEKYRKCPLTIVHGEQRQSKAELEKVCAGYSNIKLCQAKLDIPFGTHHTKMMFLLYKEGFRIIIHTSNIVESDWDQRTQGMWVSPLLPELKNPSTTEGESPTNFKRDLLEYVTAYNATGLDEWLQIIKRHDFSSVRVMIIGSVPGRFMGSKKTSFGHLKLRKILNLHGSSKDVVNSSWPVVCQFSSIGSLGATPDQWMTSEFSSSLSTVKDTSLSCQSSNMKLVGEFFFTVFPTVENVRKSLQGYPAGASLPYSIKVAQKQSYLRNFMHQWKSDKLGRSEASPHIKTYLRLSPDNCSIAWFLLTSANLSKAAWGSLEKKGSRFMIRSYELGVLFLPKFFDLDLFLSPFSTKNDYNKMFPVPFDIPLEPYSKNDEPWIWDIPHVHAPDRYGMKWCPPGLK